MDDQFEPLTDLANSSTPSCRCLYRTSSLSVSKHVADSKCHQTTRAPERRTMRFVNSNPKTTSSAQPCTTFFSFRKLPTELKVQIVCNCPCPFLKLHFPERGGGKGCFAALALSFLCPTRKQYTD